MLHYLYTLPISHHPPIPYLITPILYSYRYIYPQ
nr:MAG TPA: hypothetical protein [Caudoviricetes sp.]